MNIALVGSGYWGKNLARNFYELGVLSVICDKNEEILDVFRKKYPNIEILSDYANLLKRDDIDGVCIATPAVTHYPIARDFLLNGKDVLVEKPIALSLKDGEDLLKIAEEKGRILMVDHILRYHPAVIELKKIIDEGVLGKIEYIYSNRLNMGKLRREENILWSFAPHDISVILYLMEDVPEKVSCFGGAYIQEKIYDSTVTMLSFKNGVKAHIFVSWLHPFKEQKLIVVGDQGMAVFDDMSENEKLCLYPHKVKWQKGIPVADKSEKKVIELEKKEPLRESCKHFIECIKERKIPLTDGKEALKVLEILKKAQSSLEEGREKYLREGVYIHESSYVDENVSIGEGTKIWHFSHILKNSIIGRNCVLGQNVSIGPNVEIGNNVKIQNNVSVYEGVKLEDNVFCGPSCVFTNVINPRSEINRKSEFKSTIVKKGATIGANATIVCGVVIGSYSLIGAGSVVTKDVPDYALVYGNPATIRGWVCECGVKIEFKKSETECPSCGKRYILEKDNFVRRL